MVQARSTDFGSVASVAGRPTLDLIPGTVEAARAVKANVLPAVPIEQLGVAPATFRIVPLTLRNVNCAIR